jgi:UDP-N-acetylglucosamine--N-acetylmuramyl-(pentapeptide) pyrophosphoryl-undecaprenol N-acetylglucosamine transferase
MTDASSTCPKPKVVAIACGGTGGHLFPGIAVAGELRRRDCQVALLISAKDVDQQAVKGLGGVDVVTLPAVGLTRGSFAGFAWGFLKSYVQSRRYFHARSPQWVLGMGGFTSAPPVLAASRLGATTFLHEANTIPGRANRLLARCVDGAFVYFEQTAALLRAGQIECVGMPVRREFLEPADRAAARAALGLQAHAPVLLVMGGSQGAAKINELVVTSLSKLRQALPALQFIHLTGDRDLETTRAAYAAQNRRAVVRGFMAEMGQALAAADAAVSRAGASSLAELAARQLPSVLIPYPRAAGNHQYYNARAFAQSGAARVVPQQSATPELLAREIIELIGRPHDRAAMRRALAAWHGRDAASTIAERILNWPGRLQALPPGARLNSQKMEVLNA